MQVIDYLLGNFALKQNLNHDRYRKNSRFTGLYQE